MDLLSVNNRLLNIAVVTQYFYPERFLINDLVEELSRQGHNVVVFTGKPNYPSGTVFPGFSEDGVQTSLYKEAVEVNHAPLRARRAGGAKNLLRNYISFVWNGLLHFPRMMKGRQFDVVFVYAPSPVTSVVPAILMKLRARAPLFLWVQDLWPESLEATGFIKNKLVLKIVAGFVKAAYACVDVLLVQSNAFIGPVSRLARPEKIVYYPNSYRDPCSSTDEATPLPAYLVDYLKAHFCIVFAGNLGTAQALDTVLSAAVKLRDDPAIKLVMVGSGSKLEWLKDQVIAQGLENVLVTGPFASSAMPELFSLSAGLLVSLKNDEIFSYTIPSKVQAYLAAGKPIIASLDGEGAKIIKQAQAGFTGAAQDFGQLASAIRRLYALPALEREQLGRNGKAYFQEHFELTGQCNRLVEIFRQHLEKEKATS
jgi:glycosyltransferase involved in cell wall biosynthesis